MFGVTVVLAKEDWIFGAGIAKCEYVKGFNRERYGVPIVMSFHVPG